MKTFKVRILTPDKPEIAVDDAVSVVVPSVPGSFGVLADHAQTVAAVGTGVLRYSDATAKWCYIVVGDGAAEVTRDGMVLMVAFATAATDEIHADEILDRIRQKT